MTQTILVIGGGGREHAMVRALKRSSQCGELFCSPGNGGIAQDATCVSLDSHASIMAFCQKQQVDLVIIGPEQPLIDGLSDALREKGVATFAPSQAAAQVEASKTFTKSICDEAGIPTASYRAFTHYEEAREYLQQHAMPVVIKADGLAAGKGVVIAQHTEEALSVAKQMLDGRFGDASRTIVIEEYLQGEELSFFALCDGKQAVAFGSAQDHKTAYDGDTGPNTGGMGTYSPAPVMTDALEQRIMQEIVQPALAELAKRGTPYQGILFVGLMIHDSAPTLIEFNARFGDPETQVILSRLQDDFVTLCLHAANGALPKVPVRFSDEAALCVVMASNGYPGAYEKGSVINHLDNAAGLDNTTIYHAGTTREDGQWIANGGRVLGVTATAPTVAQAQKRAYAAIDTIDWPQGFCRRDIGWRALEHEKRHRL